MSFPKVQEFAMKLGTFMLYLAAAVWAYKLLARGADKANASAGNAVRTFSGGIA